MAPPTTKPKFNDNEKVLCYHGPLLYEAKCVKSKRDTKSGSAGEFQYFVHYQGWNKNWDEWVGESRILKINPETLEKKSKLMQAQTAAAKDKKKAAKAGKMLLGSPLGEGTPGGGRRSDSANTSRASTPTSERSDRISKRPLPPEEEGLDDDDDDSGSSATEEEPSGPPSSKKGAKRSRLDDGGDEQQVKEEGRDEEDDEEQDKEVEEEGGEEGEEEDNVHEGKLKFRVELPEELKYVLVSDWDLVVNKKSMFHLPAKSSAASIVGDFVRHVEKTQRSKAVLVQEVMLGVKDFFNEVVESKLLYRLERNQFRNVGDGKLQQPVDVYGSAHLLRLMVKLNDLLDQTSLAGIKGDVLLIEGVIQDFLSYLEHNRQKYFTSKNYVEATEEYLKTVE